MSGQGVARTPKTVSAVIAEPQMAMHKLPPAVPPTNHGRTEAAWTLTVGAIVGVAGAGVGMIVALPWLFWAGMATAGVGVVAGIVLRAAGFGQNRPH